MKFQSAHFSKRDARVHSCSVLIIRSTCTHTWRARNHQTAASRYQSKPDARSRRELYAIYRRTMLASRTSLQFNQSQRRRYCSESSASISQQGIECAFASLLLPSYSARVYSFIRTTSNPLSDEEKKFSAIGGRCRLRDRLRFIYKFVIF